MPRTKSAKSKVSKLATRERGFKFRWWMAVLLIAVIAIIGAVIVRLSQAGGNIGVLYPNMPGQVVCPGIDPGKKSLHLCKGEFVNTSEGAAWRTSVNQLGGTQWYGPYENLTMPVGNNKQLKACVTTRENIAPQFGITSARYIVDITSEFGTKTHATITVDGQKIVEGSAGANQVETIKSSPNSNTVTCITANLANTITSLKNVEYRVRLERGSVDIFQMVRSFEGGITSDATLPTSKLNPNAWRWPVGTQFAQLRGPNSLGGSGCFNAPRVGGRTHKGIDIVSNNGATTDVFAARAGTVVTVANDYGGFGPYIVIQHEPQLFSLYGHLSQIYVSPNQQVTNGQLIGETGMGGNAAGTANQVHFQIQNAKSSPTQIFNPLDFLDRSVLPLNGC